MGFKVFNPDWTCKDFKFEVGGIYEDKRPLEICRTGFHYCENAIDCFNYYSFDSNNKVAEIVALGEIITEKDKSCTNKIQILREIKWEELLTMVNTGKGCTGYCNSGNSNSGNRNSGDYNSGNYNSGYYNSGNSNSGDRNSGNYNSGNSNSGNRNSGNRNSGNSNSGNRNSGDYNSGDYNIASYSTGCFNTQQQKIFFFDTETEITMEQWRNSKAFCLMSKIKTPCEWIPSEKMTEEEKEKYPKHETTGGYLKQNDFKESCKEWWSKLSTAEKQIIKEIPNFDEEKFYQITSIKITD